MSIISIGISIIKTLQLTIYTICNRLYYILINLKYLFILFDSA